MASDLKRKRENEQPNDNSEEVELDTEIAKKHKLPTGEELRTLKDAADLYQSSSFKLQIDALLPNVRPKESRKEALDRLLLTLRSHLLSLPPIQPQHPLVAARALSENGVAVPFALPHPTQETKWTVAFEPPSDMHVVGSWANKISVKKKDGKYFGVDLSIEMPSLLFQEKDYLDARYFHKRSYYLAVVAQSISNSLEVDVFYVAALCDPRQTVLVLRPRKKTSHDFSKTHTEVRIIPTLSSSHPIPLHRLSPSHDNVRVRPDSDILFPVTSTSTPIYNTAILLSTFPKLALLSTNVLVQSCLAFRDAHTLLRVWANQRGYGEGALCVNGFEGKGSWWASIIALLLDGEEPVSILGKGKAGGRRSVGKGLSSYQLFRASLDLLAKLDFESAPTFVKSMNGHKFSPEEYASNDAAVFVDATSTINHLVDVPLSSLDMLQYDAQQTLEQLNASTGTDDVFASVFLKDQTHLSKRCDAVIRVDLLRVSKYRSTFEFVEHGSSDNALLAAVSRILRRGLGDRVRAVAIFRPSSNVRSVSDLSSPPRISAVHIGLIYSPEDAFRLVDHGPSVEEQDTEAAKQFRQLWGPKAELRRFKDGRIVESVVWEVKTSDERAHIPSLIVRHLLHLHFGIPIADIQTIATPFDSKLRLPDHLASLQHAGSTGGFKAALSAFDGLVKNLKALDEKLPLALLNVSPTSEYLRYASVFTPLPIPMSSSLALPTPLRYLPQIPILLEFEKSSKWPDDLHAIQKIKLAFFETIASTLMTAYPGLRAAVHIERPCDSDIQDHASLEVLTPEGWSFSARIWHDREAALLERLASPVKIPVDSNAQLSKDQRMARRALDLYTRRFIHAPRHHRAIATLAHRHIAYPGTVRLVKRWLASHWLLGTHVSEEAVEVICARPFVGTSIALPDTAVCIPRSKEHGFALVIEFLKDWKPENPLFVPMYEDNSPLAEPPVVAVSSKEGVWTISTSEDPSGKMWTSSGPDSVAAHRLSALAKEAYKILLQNDVDAGGVRRLFSHATDDYDIIIELDPAVLPRYHQNVDANESAWSKSRVGRPTDDHAVSRPGFDPARMLFDDLQLTYSDTLKFFFDIYGGHRIGAIWLLNVSGVRPFRALGGFSSTPAADGKNSKEKAKRDTVLLNRQSVMDEIERLGAGLIKNIIVREK